MTERNLWHVLPLALSLKQNMVPLRILWLQRFPFFLTRTWTRKHKHQCSQIWTCRAGCQGAPEAWQRHGRLLDGSTEEDVAVVVLASMAGNQGARARTNRSAIEPPHTTSTFAACPACQAMIEPPPVSPCLRPLSALPPPTSIAGDSDLLPLNVKEGLVGWLIRWFFT